MVRVNAGLDAWSATVSADRPGRWSYRVEGWSDPYGTWHHDAVIKVGARVDVELMLEEGARVLERAVAEVTRTAEQAAALRTRSPACATPDRRRRSGWARASPPAVRRELAERPLRDHVSASPDHPWLVERDRALYGAWYEIFPRSEGATFDADTGRWTSGTFATAARRLDGDRRHGLRRRLPDPGPPDRPDQPQGPQQHPARRGARPRLARTRSARPTAATTPIHPDLGTFDDFDAFVGRGPPSSAWRSPSTWR